MSWFKKHINWTYIFCLIFSCVVAIIVYSVALPSIDTSDPLYGLKIYLDSGYQYEWNEINIPDLNNLSWNPTDNGWERAILQVYLENSGNSILDIEVKAYESLHAVPIGFSVSGKISGLEPKQRTPMFIEVKQNPWLASSSTIYFHVTPISSYDEGILDSIVMAIIAIIWLTSAGWVLHQKGRSYGWLLLSLSGIGVIVILCLKNKRVKEIEAE